MITLTILCAGEGTKKDKLKMFITAILLDSIYLIPILC